MAVNGKNKGSTFERKIANMLSERFEPVTGVKQGFRRNPDSGAFFGGSNVRRTMTHNLEHANFGDIICPENFIFSVECKHYKSAPAYSSVVKGSIKQWDDWLKQAEQDAQSSNKKTFLIIKYNNVDETVFVKDVMSGCEIVLTYKGYNLYRLSDVLQKENGTFFNLLMENT